jgi:hypothetical protein
MSCADRRLGGCTAGSKQKNEMTNQSFPSLTDYLELEWKKMPERNEVKAVLMDGFV